MKYRITIEEVWVDDNEQDEYRREKSKEVYQQTVEHLSVPVLVKLINNDHAYWATITPHTIEMTKQNRA